MAEAPKTKSWFQESWTLWLSLLAPALFWLLFIFISYAANTAAERRTQRRLETAASSA